MKTVRILMFNFFTRNYLKQGNRLFFLNRRLKSMATDMFFVMAVFMPIFIPLIVLEIIYDKNNFNANNHLSWSVVAPSIPFSFITFALLNKDFFNARSVAKRVFGYQIFDVKTNEIASPLKCMIRNITMIIWPVEAIVVLFNPRRRVGDVIAGTMLKDCAPEIPESILVDIEGITEYGERRKTIFYSVVFTIIFLGITTLSTIWGF